MLEFQSITLPGFSFMLLIICVGYIFTQGLGNEYKTKQEKLGSLERIITYIILGIFLQAFIIPSCLVILEIPSLVGISNALYNLSMLWKIDPTQSLAVFLILLYFIFSIIYAAFSAWVTLGIIGFYRSLYNSLF